MQPRVMNQGCIGSKNCRFHRWMPCVREPTTERELNDVFEIELNFIRSQRIRDGIERLFYPGFKIFENRYNHFNSRLVDHPARSIDEQMDIFVKFQLRWKFHRSLTGDPPCLVARFARTFSQPFQRNTEPFRGVFSLLKYS